MDDNKEKVLPPQGERTPRGRRGGGIVPATPSSSSDAGLPLGLSASPGGEYAIAQKEPKVGTPTGGMGPPPPSSKASGFGHFKKGFLLGKPPIAGSPKGGAPPGPSPCSSEESLPGTPSGRMSLSDRIRTGRIRGSGSISLPSTPEMGRKRPGLTSDSTAPASAELKRGRVSTSPPVEHAESLAELREERDALRAEVGKLERWGQSLHKDLGALMEGGACPMCRSGMYGGTPKDPSSSTSVAGRDTAPKRAPGREAGVQTEALPPVGPPPPIRDWDPDAFLRQVGVLIDGRLAALREELLPKLAAIGTSVPIVGRSGGGGKAGTVTPRPAAVGTPASGATGPQVPSSPTGEAWTKVVGRKAARGARKPPATTSSAPVKGRRQDGKGGQKRSAPPSKKRRARLGRLPAFAAVSLTLEAGSQSTLASSITMARQGIDLRAMGIEEMRPKRALNGGLLLEIPGKDSAAKADRLAKEMAALLEGKGVRVARPAKVAEIRVCGLADDATPSTVREALAGASDCPEGDIRVGLVRMDPSGLGTAWARLPLAGARRLTAKKAVKVGWTLASVEALRQRPLRCYRCLHVGHVGQRCTSQVDRGDRCYRCSAPGHLAGACPAAEPTCPLCVDLGRPAGHRLGGAACAPRPSRGRGAAVRGQIPPAKHKGKAAPKPAAKAAKARAAAAPRVTTRAGRSGRGEAMDTT